MVFGFHGLLGHPAQAQSVTQATVTDILDGNQVYIQDRQVQVNSVARQQQRVRTGTSRTSLLFNTGAVARLAHNSSLTVGQCAQLQRGTVLVNGALNGCTSSTVAGVRGTLYTLTVDEAGAETVKVFEGSVELSRRVEEETFLEDPESSVENAVDSEEPDCLPEDAQAEIDADAVELTEDPIILEEGESLTYDPVSRLGLRQRLTEEDFEGLLRGPLISDFAEELPGIGSLRDSFDRLFPDIPFPLRQLPSTRPPISIPRPF